MRVYGRYEIGKVNDRQSDGLITGAVANYDSETLLLDAGPQNCHANVISVFVEYTL